MNNTSVRYNCVFLIPFWWCQIVSFMICCLLTIKNIYFYNLVFILTQWFCSLFFLNCVKIQKLGTFPRTHVHTYVLTRGIRKKGNHVWWIANAFDLCLCEFTSHANKQNYIFQLNYKVTWIILLAARTIFSRFATKIPQKFIYND